MADTQVAGITLRDHNGIDKNLVLYFGSAASVATITTALQAIETALDAVVDALIVDSYIMVRPALVGGLKTTLGSNSNREGASVTWHLDGSARSYNQFWPSVKDSYFTGEVLDVEDADIVALATEIAASLTPEGTVLTDVFRGKYRTRK